MAEVTKVNEIIKAEWSEGKTQNCGDVWMTSAETEEQEETLQTENQAVGRGVGLFCASWGGEEEAVVE